MPLGENPTGVNPFTGNSDSAKLESVAQGLLDRIDGKPSQATPPAPEPSPSSEVAPAQASDVKAEAEADSSDTYQDFDDFVTRNQYDRDSLFSLPVKLKVDGKDESVPLKELIDAGQLRRHAQLETQKVSAAQKAWESERAAAQQAIAQQWQQTQTLAQLARQQLLGDYQSIDWSKYSAEEQLQLERNFRARDAQIQQHLSQLQQTQASQLQQQVSTERTKLLDALPEWRDSAKLQQAKSQLESYATGRGFTQAELSQLVDHRYLLVLNDAARAKDLQAQVDTLKAQLDGKTEAALKKVRAAPTQAAQPGARVARDPKVVALSESKQSFLKNARNPDAQAAYAQALLNAGLGS